MEVFVTRLVTVSNSLSVCEHAKNIIASCAQSVQALRILEAHGMAAGTVQDYILAALAQW